MGPKCPADILHKSLASKQTFFTSNICPSRHIGCATNCANVTDNAIIVEKILVCFTIVKENLSTGELYYDRLLRRVTYYLLS